MKRLMCVLAVVTAVAVCGGCRHGGRVAQQEKVAAPLTAVDRLRAATDSVVALAGEPRMAESGSGCCRSGDEMLLRRDGYTVCWDTARRCPHWVAWVLTPERASAQLPRQIYYDSKGKAVGIVGFKPSMAHGSVIEDHGVPKPRPSLADWRERPDSMSRGHMCPAADCKLSREMMNQSFLLTNICVQTKRLNTGSWNQLEDKCRKAVMRSGAVMYVVCGPLFDGNRRPRVMGPDSIAVPDGFFKVLLRLDSVGARTIGFVYRNDDVPHYMQDAVRTVDEVEALAGLDFFPQLPDSIEGVADFQRFF